MVIKNKILEFYDWRYGDEAYTVVATRTPNSTFKFSFYIGKEEVDNTELISDFVKDLKESIQKSKQAPKRKVPRRRRK
tara:strand:- start:1850 stop:2083 length:234 start_codon:yes stop_codon:yes gene_type:complete